MGARSGGHPDASQRFIQRILHALDMTPRDLARELAQREGRSDQVRLSKDIAYLLTKSEHQITDVDRDELWFLIEAYVDEQLAYLLAVKHELNRALQKQREQRILRRQRQETRDSVSAPSSLPRRQPFRHS